MAISRNYELLEHGSFKKRYIGTPLAYGGLLYGLYFIAKTLKVVKR
tara:strand:- start:1989 stop:2126 length:138 start_codon:yes stop_codon:yes gene_type:complete